MKGKFSIKFHIWQKACTYRKIGALEIEQYIISKYIKLENDTLFVFPNILEAIENAFIK